MGYKRANLPLRFCRVLELGALSSQRHTVRSRDRFRFDIRRSGSLLALTLAMVFIGCGHKVGDSCSSGADCDPAAGTRTCDLSQPGGYCLVEGCDARSCPSDSACIRVFPASLLSIGCGPTTPCKVDEICVNSSQATNDAGASDAGGSESATPGVCARLALEKRVCLQTCGSDGDCRGGYACRQSGLNGTIGLTLNMSASAQPRICVPAN